MLWCLFRSKVRREEKLDMESPTIINFSCFVLLSLSHTENYNHLERVGNVCLRVRVTVKCDERKRMEQ